MLEIDKYCHKNKTDRKYYETFLARFIPKKYP
jgi:hypothetical protein